jgi:hypothetical protein
MLIKNQDTAFNKIPNNAMFTVKVSIHQKKRSPLDSASAQINPGVFGQSDNG